MTVVLKTQQFQEPLSQDKTINEFPIFLSHGAVTKSVVVIIFVYDIFYFTRASMEQ